MGLHEVSWVLQRFSGRFRESQYFSTGPQGRFKEIHGASEEFQRVSKTFQRVSGDLWGIQIFQECLRRSWGIPEDSRKFNASFKGCQKRSNES